MTEPVTVNIWFVQRPLTWATFTTGLIRHILTTGRNLGIGAIRVDAHPPHNAPDFCKQPGIWAEHGDGVVERIGG